MQDLCEQVLALIRKGYLTYFVFFVILSSIVIADPKIGTYDRGIEWLLLNHSSINISSFTEFPCSNSSILYNATLFCEVSEDNISFSNVLNPRWDGCVDYTNNLTSIQNLNDSTKYYFRCNTNGSGYTYHAETTDAVRESDSYFVHIIILVILLAILGLAYFKDDEVLKMITGFGFLIIAFSINAGNLINIGTVALRTVTTIIFFGFGLYLVANSSYMMINKEANK